MRTLVRPHIEKIVNTSIGIAMPPHGAHPSGKSVINFSLGDPSKVDPDVFSTPPHIRLAAATAKYDGEYFPSRGHPELVRLLSERIGTDHLSVTDGASEGMEKLIHAIAGRILLPSPCFPPYIEIHGYHGRTPVFYRVDPQKGPDLDDIRRNITDDVAAILVINPNNPTGMVYSTQSLADIIDIARKKGIAVVADEVYNKLCFYETPSYMRMLNAHVPLIEVGSFSKEYLMCGDRVGWVSFQNMTRELADLEKAILRMCASRLCSNAPGQLAAIAALKGDSAHIPMMMAEVKRRAAALIEHLSVIPGIEIVPPKAGFYLWFGLPKGSFATDIDFANRLSDNQATFIIPGAAFTRDQINGETMWFRAVFLPPVAEIIEGADRIRSFVESRG
ncbi:aminotransferase class I/II-fold pyridoxal phosphate-dependent enzyme [Candidatus Micrarchaeota archaeon]|nr:aminotransferase class I/II-fold pyridoxal phosphate-dependent enzyme [Candidatus Micrarchaeota archaeon]